MEQEITLIDIAILGCIGPLKIGASLGEIGDELGPPTYWGFGDGLPFNSYLGFGCVEAHVRSEQDDVRVVYAHIILPRIKARHGKIGESRKGNKLAISLPVSPSKLTFRFLEKLLRDKDILYSTEFDWPVDSATRAVMNFGNTICFYFGDPIGNPRLEKVEMC